MSDTGVHRGFILEPHFLAAIDRAVFRQGFGGYRREARLEVKGGRLHVDGEPLPAEHCLHGYLQPIIGSERAHLCLLDADHNVRVDVEVASADVAKQLLTALNLPADQMAVPFVATWSTGVLLAYALLVFAMTSVMATYERWWLAAILGVLLATAGTLLMRVSRYPFVVAPDGIVVERFGKRELITYDEIRSGATQGDSTLILRLIDGTERRFDFPVSAAGPVLRTHRNPRPEDGELAANMNDAVAARIAEQLAQHGVDPERLGERLARGGRSVEAWLADIGRMERGDYRGESPTSEQLWRVVEDGACDVGARAAAARLLKPRGEPDRQRLRVVSQNTASPRLRIALEVMSEEDEEAQREALAELEAELS